MRQKGFTLIELLVVISITGVLSSATLPFLGTGRDKAYDAKVKTTLGNVLNQAAIVDDMVNFCNNVTVSKMVSSVNGECHESNGIWAIYAALKKPDPSKTGLCVDVTNLKQQVNYSEYTSCSLYSCSSEACHVHCEKCL